MDILIYFVCNETRYFVYIYKVETGELLIIFQHPIQMSPSPQGFPSLTVSWSYIPQGLSDTNRDLCYGSPFTALCLLGTDRELFKEKNLFLFVLYLARCLDHVIVVYHVRYTTVPWIKKYLKLFLVLFPYGILTNRNSLKE